MKPSIKSLTVRNLITFLLVLVTILLLVTGINFRYLSTRAVENHALSVAELVRAGLTAHMKDQINWLHIIRGDDVTAQFGPGTGLEKAQDQATRKVFETRQPMFILDEFSATPTIRAIIPYVASPTGSLNCLSCHEVMEGTVLGAVDIELDVTGYRNQSLMVLGGLFVMMVFFLLLILINTSRTIQRYVQEPLESLIDNAMTAYRKHTGSCWR